MSESLGKFVIDLEARIANLESDLGRAERLAQKAAREMQASFEKGFKAIEQAADRGKDGVLEALNALTGLSAAQLGIGAVVAGLGEITKHALETADVLNKMSQRVGISVESLSGLSYAAQLADVDVESFRGGLEKFAKAASAAAGGSKEQAAAFQAIGVATKDAGGNIRPMEQLLVETAGKFAGFKDDANKTALAIALFGKSGAALIPFLNEGSEGIHKMSAEAKALGYDFAATAKPAEEFNDNLTRMKLAAVGLGNDIAKELLPSLLAAEEKTLEFIKSLRENGTLQSFASAIGFIVEHLDALVVVLGTRLAIGAAISAFEALTAAIAATGAAAAVAEGALALLGGPAGVLALVIGGVYLLTTRLDENQKAVLACEEAIRKLRDAHGEERAQLGITGAALSKDTAERLKNAEAILAQLEAKNLDLQKANARAGDGGNDAFGFGDISGYSPLSQAMAKQRSEVQALREKLTELNRELSINAALEDLGGEAAKKAAPNFTALAKAMGDDALKAQAKFDDLLRKSSETLVGILGKLNPVQKIYSDYAKGIAEANNVYQKELELSAKFPDSAERMRKAKELLIATTNALQFATKAETDAFLKQHDVVKDYLDKIADESALIGLTERQKEITKAVEDLTRAWEKNTPEVQAWLRQMGIVDPTSEEGRRKIAELTGALYDNKQAWELTQQASRDWVSIFSSAADRILSTSGNLWTRFKAGWKEMIDSVIAYTAKLALINPILNGLFGGSAGFSLLPTLANAFGGSGGTPALVQTGAAAASAAGGGGFDLNSIGTLASLFGNGGDTAGGVQGFGGITGLFSASKWIDYGKNLWSGFSTTASNFWNGANGGMNGVNVVTGQPYSFGLSNGGYGSALGQGLGIAGGIYAGYNRAQNADGAFGKIGGGLSYGLGTYALGAGLASAVGGAGFAAGVGGAFAIPWIGWAALIAMVVDKISGGNLFGTGWNPTGMARSTLTVGADDVSIANQYEEKKKKALFGGNVYKWVDTAASDEQNDFAKQLKDALMRTRESDAAVLGSHIADVITGAFTQKVDKDGKVQEQISTVLGKTYSEGIDKFAERIEAENRIAQISSARGDDQASQIAEQYRKDADQLAQAAQFLLQAQVDIQHGIGLLGDDHSLIDIGKVVSQLAQQNETLTQTYQRLQAETQGLQSTLDLMGIDIGKTGAEFVKFADAATNAAGGVQNLQTLLQGFQQAYYTADEIAKTQIAAYQKQAQNALSVLGLDPTESMADFRKAFEAALPTLSPDQLIQWLQAANYLAQATAAQKQYDDQLAATADTLKQNAETVKSILAQLDPAGDPLAGTWQGTLATINAQFDAAIEKLKTIGATSEQLAKVESDRTITIANAQKAAVGNYAQLVQQIEQGFAELQHPTSDFQKALATIGAAERDTIAQLNAAAKAAGMQAAREQDLALVHQYAAAQAAAAAHQLDLSGADLVSKLKGSNGIAQAAESAGAGLQVVAQGLNSVQDAIDKFRNSMLLDSSLSPLNTQQQYDEALKQLRATGDENIARTALDLARKLDATGDDYRQKFDLITSLVRPGADTSGVTGRSASSAAAGSGTQLSELEKNQIAQQIAQAAADKSGFTGDSYADVLKGWGYSLDQLGKDLGIQGKSLDDYLTSLKAHSYSLDDLSKLVTSEVDRIVKAIQDAFPQTVVTADTTIVGDKTAPITKQIKTPVSITAPAVGGSTESQKAEELQQKSVDVQQQMVDLLKAQTDVLLGLGKILASTGVATEDAVHDLGPKLDDMASGLRALNDGVRSVRTRDSVLS